MDNSNILLSIIIPSYNQAKFIERTINSILNQEYKNIEIIIIDGGSTDNTINVITPYLSNIKILVSEKDSGQSDAINKGFKLASGDIIGWINSDDTFEPDCFSKIIMEFRLTPNLDFIYGNVNLIDENDNIIGFLKGEILKFPDLTWQLDLPVPQQGSFWKRSAIISSNIELNTNYNYVLDRDIFIRTLIELKAGYINTTLGNFRHQENSKSISQSHKWIQEIPLLYNQIIIDYSLKYLSKNTVINIKSMVNLYLAIEYIKLNKYLLSFRYLIKSIIKQPCILFKSGLLLKIKKYLLPQKF